MQTFCQVGKGYWRAGSFILAEYDQEKLVRGAKGWLPRAKQWWGLFLAHIIFTESGEITMVRGGRVTGGKVSGKG